MATAEVLRELSPLNDAAQALDTMDFPTSPPPGARATSPPPTSTAPPITIPGVGSFAEAADAVNPAFNAQQQAKQREAEQMRIRANAMRPEYANIRTAADEQQRVAGAVPQAPTLTPPPSRGLRDFLEVSEGESPVASIAKLMQSLSLFTNVAVGGSRHNAMGALAAFAGAMKGWQEGDAMRADRGFKDWEAQTAQALKQYDLQRTQYNDALTAAGKNFDGRVKLAQIKALELGDEQAIAAFESGSLDDMLKFLAGRQDKRDDLQLKSDTLIQARADARTKAEQWLATFLAGRDDAGARERQAGVTAAETGRHNRATEANAAAKLAADQAADAAEGQAFTPQAIELAAQNYVQTGTLPPMGMGKSGVGVRAKILNRSAEIAESMGGVEGQAARTALYKANAAELVKLQVQRGPVMAFEKTARANLAIAKELSEKVDRTGTPVYNRWNLSGRKSIQGDADVAAFDAAVRTAINEVAKVTSGSTGGAVTSDSARHEIEAMLNTALTKPQFDSVVKILERDMDSRIKGFEEQIRTTTDALKRAPTSPEKKGRETLSRKDARYQRARKELGLSDGDISAKYAVDLTD